MMDEIERLEREFWLGGPQVYRRSLTEDCIVIVPPPSGELRGREAIIRSLEGVPRWAEVEFTPEPVWRTGDAILVAYRARARRAGAAPYETWASSLYVEGEDGWKLSFHQQTPG
jgi:ketosteroid isomerase-like protein